MVQHYDVIREILQKNFEISTIRGQLFDYLSLKEDGINVTRIGADYEIWAYNRNLEKREAYIISLKDELTIFLHEMIENLENGFHCHVHVAIGIYHKYKYVFQIDKCLAVFKYNDNLNLVEIEFFMEEIHKKK